MAKRVDEALEANGCQRPFLGVGEFSDDLVEVASALFGSLRFTELRRCFTDYIMAFHRVKHRLSGLTRQGVVGRG